MNRPAILAMLFAPDGAEIAEQIRRHVAGRADVSIADRQTPLTDEVRLVVCVVTPQALHDAELHALLGQCHARHLPILPIVDNLQTYDFTALPPELSMLSTRNALGWTLSDPANSGAATVFDTIRAWLGETLFDAERTLFISYCRADGQEAARAIDAYFIDRGYRTFLDTDDIPGGAAVQRFIKKAMFDRDFLVVIDSPHASASQWIAEEIRLAIDNRIKMIVLRLPGGNLPIYREIRELEYDGAAMLPEVEQIVKEAIAAKRHFDSCVEDALDALAHDFGYQVSNEGVRKVLLTRVAVPSPKNVLMEFENASHSLESLYRLHADYTAYCQRGTPLHSACFVYAGRPLSPYSQDAIRWARQQSPLEVATLDEFIAAMLSL